MTGAQAPAIPDAGSLAGLDPGVAYAFLAVVALSVILFYFGGALRDRFKPRDPPAKTAEPPTASPVAALLPVPQAMDRAADITDRYIDDLKAQIEALSRENDQLERDLRQVRADYDRVRDDAWRRGR